MMQTERPISSFLADHMLADPSSSLLSLFAGVCGQCEISNATYFGSSVRGAPEGEDIVVTTYNPGWIERYFDREYQNIDPVIGYSSKSILPLDWATLEVSSDEERNFFGEAGEFGVSPLGLTIPIRGIHGDTGLFSVNVDVRRGDWDSYRQNHIADLTYAAFLVHNHVVRQHVTTVEESPLSLLTDRERDVLLWAARGKTAWETGEILKLSENTVAFYLRKICVKLEAASKVQAVAMAVSQGLIHPY